MGFRIFSISALRSSKNGGKTNFSPSVSISSPSTVKPGPSVAISKESRLIHGNIALKVETVHNA